MVRSGLIKMVYNSINQIFNKKQQAYLFNKPKNIVALKRFLAQRQSIVLLTQNIVASLEQLFYRCKKIVLRDPIHLNLLFL